MESTKPFELTKAGGDISLDFMNTANFHGTEHHQEWLKTQADLVEWSEFIGLRANDVVQAGDIDLKEILKLRESMYGIIIGTLHQTTINEDHLTTVNHWLQQVAAYVRISQTEDGTFVKELKNLKGLKQIVFPVVLAFEELLTSSHIKKVKQCNSERCEWLFIDKTKNQSKQWCTMDVCGNREKAKRFYHSKKK